MTRDVDGGGALTAKVRYEIEDGYDYAFLEASSDGGETWDVGRHQRELRRRGRPVGLQPAAPASPAAPTASGSTSRRPSRTAPTRCAGATSPTAAGRPASRSTTSPSTARRSATPRPTTRAGRSTASRTTTGSEEQAFLNAYFVDNRQYVGRDKQLKHLYNFGFPKKPDWVEFFHNEPGALITYWDTSYSDNNVGDHPGAGEILPVDAHPDFRHEPDGSLRGPGR